MTRLPALWEIVVVRFLLAGAVNTGTTYGLYLALLLFLPYLAAYSVTYATGIVVSYLLNSLLVFRQPLSLRRFAAFPLVYVVQYAVGTSVLWVAVQKLSIDHRLAFLRSGGLSVPVSFVASRWLLSAKPADQLALATH